jgi:hypothetical protein
MARYKMTVLFNSHEELEMKYLHQEEMDGDKVTLAYEAVKSEDPHINKLYDDLIERIETSLKHPITYDIVSFEKMK